MASGYHSPYGGSLLAGTAPLSFTSAASTAQVNSNITVEWDLDNDGDFSSSLENITSYVMSAQASTGRDYPSSLTGKSGPGRLRLTLNNNDNRFTGSNPSSPLNAAPFSLATGRKIRVRTNDGVLGSSLITYVGIGALSQGNNLALTPALPSGLLPGDLMLCEASIRNSGTGTVDVPPGWAPLIVSGNVSMLARYYESGDGPPAVTFTGGVVNATTMAQVFAYRGTHQSLGQVVAASATQLNGVTQNIAYPALTVPENNCAIILAGWKQDDWTSVAPIALEISDSPSTLGDDAGQVIDYFIQTTATNIGAGSFTVTGGATAISRAFVFALRPAVNIGDPTLLARDRFARVDGPFMGTDETGKAWAVAQNGGYAIRAGRAQAVSGRFSSQYNVDIIQTIDVSSTDMYVQAAIPMIVQDGKSGVVARYLDNNNYLRCYYDGASRGVRVEQMNAGILTSLGLFNIESWDGMVLGLGVKDEKVTAYIGGAPLKFSSTLYSSRPITGTKAGLYGKWQTHSDVAPQVDDFYVWDRVRSNIDGVIWTGTVKSIKTKVRGGTLKVATLEAEGPLASAALTEIAAPRIPRFANEYEFTGVNHSVPAGCIAGDIMCRAGIFPPHPLPTNPISHLGPYAVKDAKALELARLVETAEHGFIRETQEGGVCFEDRDYRDTASSVAWFSDTPTTGQYRYEGVEPFDQQAQVINRAHAQVAAICPTIVSVTNQSGSDPSSLDVVITMPAVSPGDLVLVFISCSALAAGVEFGSPPNWKNHRQIRSDEGNGMRVFSLICKGGESGSTVYFYKGTTQGSFIAHIYRIQDWYGTDDGIKLGRVSQGNNAYPISPGWNRAPATYIVVQVAIGANSGLLWGPLNTPPPIGYDYLSLAGLVVVTTPAYEVGVESVNKCDVTDVEQPRPWENVFTDYLLLETVVMAVRGFNGPVEKNTIDNPGQAQVKDGQVVQVEDYDSQAEHNFIRSNPEIPVLHYTEGDATTWCTEILDEFSEDRPIISLAFTATKNAALREQAMRRRVSDKITVTATGNAGLGIEGDFFIESISHTWTHGTKLWETVYELGPA